jgi:hypothetical protein
LATENAGNLRSYVAHPTPSDRGICRAIQGSQQEAIL